MKIRASIAAVAALGMVVAVGSPAGAASKANAKVMMTGDCADGEMLEGTDEDDCQVMVSITPKSKNTSAVLEVAYDEEDPEWEELDSGKTRGGRLIFDIPSTDEDDVWMDGVVLYRVRVKKTAGLSVAPAKTYKIEYVSSENVDEEDTAMSDEDKEFNAEMDKAQADNKQKIQQQQPNQQVQSDKSMQGPPQNFNKAGEFNRACGAIGFPKDKCDQLVAAKAPSEALKILGSQSEKWCVALVNSKEQKVTCDMVLPKVFPPING
ncbi:MAG: hypothetical protein RL430_591 [Actinomycetota bacterium]|jgi:hypothetical protein